MLSAVASLVLLLVVVVVGRGSDDGGSSASNSPVVVDSVSSVSPTPSVAAVSSTSSVVASDGSECVEVDTETIDVGDLPDEAIDTLELIDSDGPFPYDQDGATFQNRERLLPQHERGYYEEYTVETPGSDDRGARRIVTGDCGERWYTDDHYDSFSLIVGTP